VKPIQLDFDENPAGFTASYVKRSGFETARTLIVCPSQRFKGYFAFQLMEAYNTDDLLSPSLLTITELTSYITATLGHQIANDSERMSMFYIACKKTGSVDALFPGGFLASFSSLKYITNQIWSAFDELNAEELSILEFSKSENGIKEYYPGFKNHFDVLRDLYSMYLSVQKEACIFDRSFLFQSVVKKDISAFFGEYDNVILVSPLALTGFEKRLFDNVNEKLSVIYQDTPDYDFSRLLGYVGKRSGSSSSPGQNKKKSLVFFEVSSRITQLMTVLSLIREEIEAGADPHEIAVINIDSLFCEMLYDSLRSLGITVNYSEGLPVKKSPLYSLLSLVDRFFNSDFDSEIFVEICRNALFREASGTTEAPADLTSLKKKIIKDRIFSVPLKFMGNLPGGSNIQEAFILLKDIYDSESFSELYANLNKLFKVLTSRKTYEFNIVKEALLNAALDLQDLEIEVREKPFDIFLEQVSSKKYPVLGEYSRGIQIIGLLESRGIKFRTVILPSFNENFLPAKSNNDILLSLNLRKDLKLPTFLDREDLEFYYLMRILDSAESAYLVSINDKKGEIEVRSRFYYHVADYYRIQTRRPDILSIPIKSYREDATPVKKEVPAAVMSLPINRYSRLDLDRIKKCETRYYIGRILGIGEEETLSKKIELNLVGLKVHSIFTKLYRDLDERDRPYRFENFREKFNKLFESNFSDTTFYTAEEALAKKILKSSLLQAVKNDLSRFNDGHTVCGEFIEKKFSAEIGIDPDKYNIQGRIDRVDRTPSDGYLIVDYKTGRLPEKALHFAQKDFIEVQLGFYGLLFKKTCPELHIEGLCYYDLMDKKDMEMVVVSDQIDGYLTEFEDHLTSFFNAFNMKDRLSLAADYEDCRYCHYFNICRVLEE
jgi:hypothetical protein